MGLDKTFVTLVGIELPEEVDSLPEGLIEELEKQDSDEPLDTMRDVTYVGQNIEGFDIQTLRTHENSPESYVLGATLSSLDRWSGEGDSWSESEIESVFDQVREEFQKMGIDQEPSLIQIVQVL